MADPGVKGTLPSDRVGSAAPCVLAAIGIHRVDLDDLLEVLNWVAPGRFAFRRLSGSLAEIDPKDVAGCVIVAGDAGLPSDISVVSAARDLRLEQCLWTPIHLLLRGRPVAALELEAWGIQAHSLPVADVGQFVEILAATPPLPRSRRIEVLRSLLTAAADDLAALCRAVEPGLPVEPERARAALGEAITLLAVHGEALGTAAQVLMKLREKPVLGDSELAEALSRLLEVEHQARVAGAERLSAGLHRVAGTLRLARWRPEVAEDVASRLQSRIVAVLERGVPELPDELAQRVRDMLTRIVPPGSEIDRGVAPMLGESCPRAAGELCDTIRALEPAHLGGMASATVQRIVVVEDDPDWLREITRLLHDLHLRVQIQSASSLREAAQLLGQAEPALALVDLGLPEAPGGEAVLDAGLVLIRQFTGRSSRAEQFPHRFLILTGVEGRAETVRRAVALGISPAGYVRKDPETWQTHLRLQVRIALQPLPDRLPLVEVFKRTGRVARVEGLEITLPYPTWCFLSALAERPGAWRQPGWVAEALAAEPYRLDPGTEDLDDPEERIERQLPHYASDLRALLAEAYRQVHHHPPPRGFVETDQFHRYRLQAVVRSLGHVEEYYAGMIPARRPSVLVVEDDPDWGRAITEELRRSGFDTRWANSADAARQLVAETVPDLVSLDLELPANTQGALPCSANGIALLGHLRREFPRLPVAVLTSIADRDQEMLHILSLGVRIDDYLSKGDVDALGRLAGSLARLWQERLTGTNILDWDPLAPVHPIRIDPSEPMLTHVAGHLIQMPQGRVRTLMRVLSEHPNVFVSRTELIEAVYPDPETAPDNPEEGLKAITRRLRRIIDAATQNETTGVPMIPGNHVICGERGVLWLRGLVQ